MLHISIAAPLFASTAVYLLEASREPNGRAGRGGKMSGLWVLSIRDAAGKAVPTTTMYTTQTTHRPVRGGWHYEHGELCEARDPYVFSGKPQARRQTRSVPRTAEEWLAAAGRSSEYCSAHRRAEQAERPLTAPDGLASTSAHAQQCHTYKARK